MLRLYAPFKDLGFMIRANQRSLAIPDRYAEPFARDTRRIGTHALGRIFTANLSFELPLDPIPRDRPTLLLAGEKEQAMVKEATRELGGRVQGATVRMVRDGVHNWPLVQPVLFARVLRAWLTNADLPAELVALR